MTLREGGAPQPSLSFLLLPPRALPYPGEAGWATVQDPWVLSPQVGFEDVIAEPVSTHSFDKVWICSHALFEISKYVIYKFLTVFLAIPLAFAAGILFAILSCLHIWWEGAHWGGPAFWNVGMFFAPCPLPSPSPRPACRRKKAHHLWTQ